MQYQASIILACYNKERYLARAIDSLIALSRFDEFEIIIVDDRSTDSSAAIAKAYADQYDNIISIVLPEGSGSPSKPRNIGIERSTADYLIFMDPDDMVINDGYSVLLTKMEEYRSDILIGTRIGINDAGVKVFTDFIDERFTYINQKSQSIALDLLNRRPFILKTIYRKRLIVDNDIRFNEKLRTSEDEAFDMRCVAAASTITKINDIVYQYTVGSQDSITTRVTLKVYEGMYDVLTELIEAYRLSFSDAIVAERILSLVDVFYIYRMAFLSTFEEVEQACEYLYDSFDRIGYSQFDCLVTRKNIDLLDAIRNRRINQYVISSFIKRIDALGKQGLKAARASEKSLARQDKQIRRLKKKDSYYANLHERKIIRAATYIAKRTSRAHLYDTTTPKPSPKKDPASTSPEMHAHILQLAAFAADSQPESNGYWVFTDRSTNGLDNAEALYRHVMTNGIHREIAFVLRADSPDWNRLGAEGFNLIEWGSIEHWSLLRGADYYFTSHCDNYLLLPWYHCGRKAVKAKVRAQHPVHHRYKLVFLQHGVIRSDLSGWLGTKQFHRIVTSSPIEAQSLLDIPHYELSEEQVALTGLPRWDRLVDNASNVITIFPTWRKELYFNSDKEDFDQLLNSSPFLRSWVEFCNSDAIKALAKDNTVQFVTHADNAFLADCFREKFGPHIKVVAYTEIGSFSDIVSLSKALITDYSSFSFDFLYLRKPVVYFDFEQNALKNNYRGMEYRNFGWYCTTCAQAVQAIESLASNGFAISPAIRKNIDDLLPLSEPDHCQRLLENVLEQPTA